MFILAAASTLVVHTPKAISSQYVTVWIYHATSVFPLSNSDLITLLFL